MTIEITPELPEPQVIPGLAITTQALLYSYYISGTLELLTHHETRQALGFGVASMILALSFESEDFQRPNFMNPNTGVAAGRVILADGTLPIHAVDLNPAVTSVYESKPAVLAADLNPRADDIYRLRPHSLIYSMRQAARTVDRKARPRPVGTDSVQQLPARQPPPPTANVYIPSRDERLREYAEQQIFEQEEIERLAREAAGKRKPKRLP